MKVSVISFFFLLSSMLFGKDNFKLLFDQGDFSFMELSNFRGEIILRYSDTEGIFKNIPDRYKSQAGTYRLRICYKVMISQIDTISYDFQLNGKEIDTEISVMKQRMMNINTGKVSEIVDPKVILSICKYYSIPQGVKIELHKTVDDKGHDWPQFKLTNNTQLDLYGEFIAGEFSGSISYQMADSTWGRAVKTGTDYTHINREPLNSGQSTIATIGDYLPRFFRWQDGRYRYRLIFSDTGNSTGAYFPTISNENVKLSIQNVSLYKMDYEFNWKREN